MNRSIRIGVTLVALAFAAIATNGCAATVEPVGSTSSPAASVPDVSGSWTTQWGSDEVCMLQIQQNGASLSGSYTTTGAPPGGVSGTLDGNVWTGTWNDQAGGGGAMVLTFSEDGRSFSGTWGSGTSSTNGGSWTGTR